MSGGGYNAEIFTDVNVSLFFIIMYISKYVLWAPWLLLPLAVLRAADNRVLAYSQARWRRVL